MFKTTEELKAFILWCKKNKLKSFSQSGTSFELSDLAFIEHLNEQEMEDKTSTAMDNTLIDTAREELSTQASEDEDLYWSSN